MFPHYSFGTLILYVVCALLSTLCLRISIKAKPLKGDTNYTGYLGLYVIYILLAVLRYVGPYGLVGIDSYQYETLFLNCLNSFTRFEEQDLLYGFLTKLIRHVTSNPVIFRFIWYSVIIFGYIFFIKTFSRRWISVIPFIALMIPYLKSLNTMRSSIAAAVILIGICLFYRKYKISGILLIISAVFIHRMSIIFTLFIPFYWIFNKYKIAASRTKLLAFSSVIIIIGYTLAIRLQSYVIANNMLEGADMYYIQKTQGGNIFAGVVVLFPLVLILAMWLICQKRIKKLHVNIPPLLTMMVIYDIILTPAAMIMGMWRANEYFLCARLMLWAYLIPVFLTFFKPETRNVVRLGFFFGFTGWLIYRILREWEPCGLMPYLFIWS